MNDAERGLIQSSSPAADQPDAIGNRTSVATGVALASRRSLATAEPDHGIEAGEQQRPDELDEVAGAALPADVAVDAATDVAATGAVAASEDDLSVPDGPVTSTEAEATLATANGTEPRRRRRTRALVVEDGEEVDAGASIGPMVRHLSALTKELTEAQRTVGHLTAERDLLRRQVAERQAAAPLAEENGHVRPNKEARIEAKLEAKAAKQAERTLGPEPVPSPEELQGRAHEVGRRRRLIALSVLGVISLTIVVWRVMGWPSPVDDMSKRGLTGIAYIGPFMNVLIGCFLIYRIVRVGSKAGNWLFPSAEEPKKRRR